jgi:hypothetical protein
MRIKRPQAKAPKASDGMFTKGVAFSREIWHISPASNPMMRDCPTFGRVRMIAKQYIAMTKLGFMPAKERKLATVSFSTAPAAKSTAMRMRS